MHRVLHREFLFVIAIISILFGAAFFSIDRIRDRETQMVKDSLERLRDNVQTSYRHWNEKRVFQIETLMRDPTIRQLVLKLLSEGVPEDGKVTSTLTDLRATLSPIVTGNQDLGFFVISESGTSLGSMRDANLWIPNLIREKRPTFFQRVLSGETILIPTIISDVCLQNAISSCVSPTLFIATPIRNDKETVVGVFTLRIDYFRKFSYIAQQSRMGKSGEAYAFDKNGIMVTESRFCEQLDRIGMVQGNQATGATLRLADPGRNLLEWKSKPTDLSSRPLTQMASSAILGNRETNLVGYRDYRGVPVVGAWSWDNELSLGIAYEMDKEEAFSGVVFVRKMWIFVIVLVSIGVASLLGVLAVLRIRWEKSSIEKRERLLMLNRRLVQARNEAQQASRMKSHFLNNINHEFRTPLNVINGNVYLLNQLSISPHSKEIVSSIERAGNDLLKLIDNILTLSDLNMEKSPDSDKLFDLHNVVTQLRDFGENEAVKKELEFDFQIDADVPRCVFGDKLSVYTAVSEILSNAVKFTETGTIGFHVQLSAHRKEIAEVSFCVIDTGVGMTDAETKRIFTPFFQLDDSIRREFDGIGVGLAVCQKLVEKMNGAIGVESTPGEGSHFSVLIPFVVSHGEECLHAQNITASSDIEPSILSDNQHIGEIRLSTSAASGNDEASLRNHFSILESALCKNDLEAKKMVREMNQLFESNSAAQLAIGTIQADIDAFRYDMAHKRLVRLRDALFGSDNAP